MLAPSIGGACGERWKLKWLVQEEKGDDGGWCRRRASARAEKGRTQARSQREERTTLGWPANRAGGRWQRAIGNPWSMGGQQAEPAEWRVGSDLSPARYCHESPGSPWIWEAARSFETRGAKRSGRRPIVRALPECVGGRGNCHGKQSASCGGRGGWR